MPSYLLIIGLLDVEVRECVGRVADVCPFCGEVRTLRAYHVYKTILAARFLGGGEQVGLDIECESCSGAVPGRALDYTSYVNDSELPLESVIAETHPQVRQRRTALLDLWRRARSNAISNIERADLIRETLVRLSPHATRLARRGLPMALLPVLALFAGAIITGLTGGRVNLLPVSGGVFLLLLLFRMLIRRSRVRRRCLPPLVRALRPLQPSSEELAGALAHLGPEGAAVVRSVRTRALLRAIAADHGGDAIQ